MAPKGNQNSKKLKDKETKEKVYKDYCEHIAKGLAHKSWYYEDEHLTLTWETIETYLKNDSDFDSSKKQIAEAKGFRVWENIGMRIMMGEIKNPSPVIWQINLRNRYGWDKDQEAREDNKCTFNQWKEEQKAKG